MIISLREIPNCFAIGVGGSETLPYGGAVHFVTQTTIYLPIPTYLARNSQNATALAAATFRESTPLYMGIFTV